MPANLSLTDAQVLTALGTVLQPVVLTGTTIIRGQVNRVASPLGNFIVLTPLSRVRLATNTTHYADSRAPAAGDRAIRQPTQVTVQIDVHGPASTDNAQIITTLLRDEYGCKAFAATGFEVQPLFAGDGRQMPFLTSENQYEDRWVVDAVLQATPIVTIAQEFADSAEVGVISVDAIYPPGAP